MTIGVFLLWVVLLIFVIVCFGVLPMVCLWESVGNRDGVSLEGVGGINGR